MWIVNIVHVVKIFKAVLPSSILATQPVHLYLLDFRLRELYQQAGKIPFGRPRRRWEGNITMDPKEISINTRNWVDSAMDRNYWTAFVNVALSFRVPLTMELVS